MCTHHLYSAGARDGDQPVSGGWPTRARTASCVKLLAGSPIVRLRRGIGVLAIGFAHPGVLAPSKRFLYRSPDKLGALSFGRWCDLVQRFVRCIVELD